MKKIDEREEQLKKQMKNTEQFNETLSEYEIKQGNLMNIAENLIKSARTALNYKTAESISAAFNTQYTEAKENSHYQYWLWGAMGFVFLTLFIGIWILTGWFIHNDIDPLFSIIGRISMIPFTILGAIFCANQYIKQKNLIEDYAYKCVLAKSMIAFSEELRGKDSEKYSEYLSTVLQQVIELVKLAKQ